MKSDELKEYAGEALVRSKDEVSNSKEIIDKLKDKIIIIKENNSVEIILKNEGPQVKIPLYLIGKFIGYQVLNMITSSSADIHELSTNLNLPIKALSRPIGILLNEKLIEKTSEGFQIRTYQIINFLNLIDNSSKNQSNKIKLKSTKHIKSESINDKPDIELKLQSKGLLDISKILNLSEDNIRKIVFVRENDATLIDTKFINTKSIKELQLNTSLAILLIYKYIFNLEKCPSSLLRKKLSLLGVKSLVNLTTNLHKYPEYVLHDAGKVGSIDNYFFLTQPGEEKIKILIKEYLEAKNG